MSTINKVMLAGRLGADPEERHFSTGGSTFSFSIATSSKYRDKVSGEWKEKTTWHTVVLKDAIKIASLKDKLKKGDFVFVEGSLMVREYPHQRYPEVIMYKTEISVGYDGKVTKLMKGGVTEEFESNGKQVFPRALADKEAINYEELINDEIPF